jgi:hypothetical protein
LLTKRTYFVPVLVAAASAGPFASGAAADTTSVVAVGKARPLTVERLVPPVATFHRTIRVVTHELAVKRRAAERRRRQRREEMYTSLPGGVPIETLESIASCESGGDPTAVSSDGSYRGKYQFDYGTWESVGGSGDPAAAPEAEQDYRAALLYAQSGSSPWPICG